MAVYEKLGTEVPKGALFTCVVPYAATPFAAGTIQYVCVAPFDAKVVKVEMINNTTIGGGDTGVALSIDGGSAIDTLQTGAGTIGLVDSYAPVAGSRDEIDEGETLEATSDATATSGDVVLVVTLQKRES